jgi:UDP-2-acetamido-3-amino-2,3-dideoxy-glucuronate N-acetyltransferase
MVGAGAVVTRSVPSNAIVVGNPARIVGYVDAEGTIRSDSEMPNAIVSAATKVRGVELCTLPRINDLRGSLSVGEFQRSIKFKAKRYFLVFDVPSAETRGEHAHRKCQQFLICVRGSISVVADDGINRQEFTLNRPELGLYLAPMVWGVQYRYSADAVLLVFASHYYDPADYIREYDQFLREVRDSG